MSGWGGCQGGREWRSEVFVKIQKKNWRGGGGSDGSGEGGPGGGPMIRGWGGEVARFGVGG